MAKANFESFVNPAFKCGVNEQKRVALAILHVVLAGSVSIHLVHHPLIEPFSLHFPSDDLLSSKSSGFQLVNAFCLQLHKLGSQHLKTNQEDMYYQQDFVLEFG